MVKAPLRPLRNRWWKCRLPFGYRRLKGKNMGMCYRHNQCYSEQSGGFCYMCERESAAKIVVASGTSTNNARDVIAALEKELHQNYQPCHPFSRDDVIQWLRQHTPVA